MLVEDVMTKDVKTLADDDSLEKAARLFADEKISGAPVTGDNGKEVGIVTEADILRAVKKHFMRIDASPVHPLLTGITFVDETEGKDAKKIYDKIATLKIKDIMTRDVFTASPKESIEDAILKMVNNRVNRLPVLENGQIVGIVSRADLLRGVAKSD